MSHKAWFFLALVGLLWAMFVTRYAPVAVYNGAKVVAFDRWTGGCVDVYPSQ